MLYMHPVVEREHSEPSVQRKSHSDRQFLNLKMNRTKIMYFWYLTQCEPVVHIYSIAATHSHCEGPQQTRRSLTTQTIRGSIPGNGQPLRHRWKRRTTRTINFDPHVSSGTEPRPDLVTGPDRPADASGFSSHRSALVGLPAGAKMRRFTGTVRRSDTNAFQGGE